MVPRSDRSLFAMLPGMAYRCLPDDRFTMLWVSDGAEALLGHEPAALVGPDAVPWREIIHPDDHELGRRTIAAALAIGTRFETAFRFVRRDGAVRWGFVRGCGVFDDAGALTAIEGFIQDITAFRQLEEARQEALDNLEAFFNADHIGFSVMRPVEDGRDAVFVLASPVIAQYYGRTVADLQGRRLRAVQPDATLVAQFLERLQALRDTGERQLWTVRATIGGAAMHVLLSMVRLDRWEGEPGHVAIAAVDISRQAEAEERLRRMQKLEAIGQLTTGLAHDFNNVLAAVSAHVELLAEQLRAEAAVADDAALSDTVRAELAGIRAAIGAGAALTTRLLATARQGTMPTRRIEVGPILDAVTLLARRLLGGGIRVVETRSAALPAIEADASQIEQALLNLVVNARDAMPSGGTLSIDAHVVPDAARAGGRLVVLAVEDTGEGMGAETQARAFEPFYTTKAEGRGTGLGLAMVAEACRAAGGEAVMRSSPGRGTRVELRLPAVAE